MAKPTAKSEVAETNNTLLTVRDIADRLQLHPATVMKLLQDGLLKGFKTRQRRGPWRITESEFNRYIEQITQGKGK